MNDVKAEPAIDPHLARISPLLRCPACAGEFSLDDTGFRCQDCDEHYPLHDGVPMLARKGTVESESQGDWDGEDSTPYQREYEDFAEAEFYNRAYQENVQHNPHRPTDGVPSLLETVQPLHAVVDADLFAQGCPPSADAIWHVLTELVAGRVPDPTKVTRFGA